MGRQRQIILIIVLSLVLGLLACNIMLPNSVRDEENNTTYLPNTQTITEPTKQLDIVETPVVPVVENNFFDEYHEEKCMVIDNESHQKLTGKVVLTEFDSHETMLFDLESNLKIDLGKTNFVMAISPNHKELAYITEDPPLLIVVDKDGKKMVSKAILPEWKSVISWIDEDNLMIAVTNENMMNDIVIFNLLTEEVVVYSPEFPSFQAFEVKWENYRDSKMVFSPDFSVVIYPHYGEGGYLGYMVYDLNRKEIIFKQNKMPEYFVPIWSKDSSYFISDMYPKYYDNEGDLKFDNEFDDFPYIGGSDIYKISKDGEILERFTYFSSLYFSSVEKISISNDQQKIAFWVNLKESRKSDNENRELVIMDLKTNELKNTCLTIKGRNPGTIIWSPDDQYLLVNFGSSTIDQGIVFVDLSTWNAIQMDWYNQIAKGWILSN